MLQSFTTVKPGCKRFCWSIFCYYLYFCLISCFSGIILFIYVNCTFYAIPSKTNGSSGTGPAYFPENPSSPPVFSGIRVTRSSILCMMYCRSLFVPLPFFFWPQFCLSSSFTDSYYSFGIFKLVLPSSLIMF